MRELVLLFSVAVAEEVAFVPGWALGIVGNQVAAQKDEAAVLGSFVEHESWLLHIVAGLMVSVCFPFREDRSRIDLGIGGLESRYRKDGGDSLLHKGILIAANKNDLLGHGVRTYAQMDALRGFVD